MSTPPQVTQVPAAASRQRRRKTPYSPSSSPPTSSRSVSVQGRGGKSRRRPISKSRSPARDTRQQRHSREPATSSAPARGPSGHHSRKSAVVSIATGTSAAPTQLPQASVPALQDPVSSLSEEEEEDSTQATAAADMSLPNTEGLSSRSSREARSDKISSKGSSTLFQALLIKCLKRQVMAICRYTPRRNTPPIFVALVPQEEKLDDENVPVKPPGFNLIFIPFADDIRTVNNHEIIPASEEQVDKMKEIVHKLRFNYRSDSFENPVLQQHFRNLEALALDLMEPEPIEDLTLPKTNMIDNRLGSLSEEFKELVYPPGYNPESKAGKRKQGDNSGQAGKKAKTETSISEADLRAYVEKGTLGKLTVPVLKEFCRNYGLKGGKKQELVDALVDYFSKN